MRIKPALPSLTAAAAFSAALFFSACSPSKEESAEEGESSAAPPSEASSSSASLRTPFESLPAETMAALRFDNSQEERQRYVDSTQVGRLLLSDEKVAEYKAFVESYVDSNADGQKLVESLAEFGLDLEDLYGMLSSHIGGAVVLKEIEGFSAMPTIFLWSEMDQDVVDHVYTSIIDAAAERENIERIDQDLAGVVGSRIRNTEDGSSFLTAKLENRFLFGIGMPVDPVGSIEQAEIFEEAEWEAFGRFVQAQQENGDGFLTRFYDELGASHGRPDFDSRLELLGDLHAALDFVPAQSAQMVELLELRDFNTLGVWSGLQGNNERSKVFFGSPAPRSGFSRMFEMEAFEFDVPAWVPSSANTYSTTALDLPRIYDVALDIGRSMMPPETLDQQIAGANEQLKNMMGIEIETLLASFGDRVHALEFPVETVQVPVAGEGVEVPKVPSAFVMDFSRPDVLETAMAMMAGFASNPESGMEIIYEQGFAGLRIANPTGGAIIAHGLGKLVFATSESAASRTFAVLNNAPQGAEALANDADFRAFMSRSNVGSGIGFSYSQGQNVLKNITPAIDFFTNALGKAAAGNEDQMRMLEEFKGLLPTEDELEGILGSLFTRVYYDDQGFFLDGVNELR